MRGMAIRANHYDAAFEEYLRSRRVPYVAVDETRRALLADSSIKSFDFIVEAASKNLLIDVKGRKWAAGNGAPSRRSTRRWENWATEDDIGSLLRWETVFGEQFRAALVFAYLVENEAEPPTFVQRDGAELFEFRGRAYFFTAVAVSDYAESMKTRSRGWNTVSLSAADYARFRCPVESLLDGEAASEKLSA